MKEENNCENQARIPEENKKTTIEEKLRRFRINLPQNIAELKAHQTKNIYKFTKAGKTKRS